MFQMHNGRHDRTCVRCPRSCAMHVQTDIYIYIYIYKYRGISNRTRLLASLRSLRSRRSANMQKMQKIANPRNTNPVNIRAHTVICHFNPRLPHMVCDNITLWHCFYEMKGKRDDFFRCTKHQTHLDEMDGRF